MPSRSPCRRVVRAHCRRVPSPRGRKPSDCATRRGSPGHRVRRYGVPRGCRAVTFDATAEKPHTVACVRLPRTDPRFRALFRDTVSIELYLHNVYEEAVRGRQDALLLPLQPYARAVRNDDKHYVLEPAAHVDPKRARGTHYCLVPSDRLAPATRVRLARAHLEAYASAETLADAPAEARERARALAFYRDALRSLGGRRVTRSTA
jgi:hypothetical protein